MDAVRKTINGTEYAFGAMPAREAVKVEVAIARVIGEPLFKAAVETHSKGKTISDEDKLSAIASAIGLLTSKMDADELLGVMDIVFKYVSADNQRINIDSHFTGRNSELWQVFMEALQVNFSDFFKGSLFSSLQKQMPKLS